MCPLERGCAAKPPIAKPELLGSKTRQVCMPRCGKWWLLRGSLHAALRAMSASYPGFRSRAPTRASLPRSEGQRKTRRKRFSESYLS